MKKIFALVFTVAMLVTLTGCIQITIESPATTVATESKRKLTAEEKQAMNESAYGRNLYYATLSGQVDRSKLTDDQKRALYKFEINTGRKLLSDFSEYDIKKYGLDE